MKDATTSQLDEPFLDAASICSDMLTASAIAPSWETPSALARLSVGALACHLGRQITRAAELLDQPSDLPVLASATEHYAQAAWVTAHSLDDPANDRSIDDAEAALGHDALLRRVSEARVTTTTQLETGTAGSTVSIPWQGWALRRNDFLLTRLLEIVVHTTDLAVSLEITTPTFPADAFNPVRDLLVALSQQRHGQPALINTLTRSERTQDISAF